MAPQIKYSYFDLPARGEMARLTLVLGKIPFDDDRVSFDKWPAMKQTTPLGSVPVADIDGTQVVQSMALARYFGKMSNLYPTDPWKALMVDQVTETVMDMQNALFSFSGTCKKEMKAAREKTIREDGARYWGGCEKMLDTISDGPFVLGRQVSIADVCIAVIYLFLKSEYLEFIPHNALDKYSKMHNVFKSVMESPHVRAWYQKHPIQNLEL